MPASPPRNEHAMHFNRLDLNPLVALNVLLEEKNVTRAGERLHLSQSAMSSTLARLREYFQDNLLVPVGRRMAPTPRLRTIPRPPPPTTADGRRCLLAIFSGLTSLK